MTERKSFSIGNADGYSDEIEAIVDADGVSVMVDNPWAGSTETGFGNSSTIRLTRDDARRLGQWLLDATR